MSTIENVIEKIYEYSYPAIFITAAIALLFFILLISAPKSAEYGKLKVVKAAICVLRFFDAAWFAVLASSGLSYLANIFFTKSGNAMFFLPAADTVKGIVFLSLIGFSIVSISLGGFRLARKKLLAAKQIS